MTSWKIVVISFIKLMTPTLVLTLFRIGVSKKALPTSFAPVVSRKFSSQNFLTFSFNPLVTLVSNFKAILSASFKLLNLNQVYRLKNNVTYFKILCFKKTWRSQFCWHHQNWNRLYQKNSLMSQKSFKNWKLRIKMQSISVFLDIKKVSDFH